ncbi:MAG TPA: putative porin, partial [Pyrinomonadaceae bacterium]|nr:putative porin [Pyrinomonadaceae bacterium]
MIHAAQRALLVCALFAALAPAAFSQTPAPDAGTKTVAARPNDDGDAASLDAVRRQLQEQQAEIERLRSTLAEQSRLLNELLARTARTDAATIKEAAYSSSDVAATDTLRAANGQPATKNAQTDPIETRVGRAEAQAQKASETIAKQLGSITFSGDLRLRYETIFGQLNALANAANPAILGNELSERNRVRLRGRLAVRGQIGKEFDWGLRLATGSNADVTSSNQTLSDFFNRKEFGLDQAYLTYRPSAIPGLRLQGGKFETPWLFTELTWDVDVQPEGFNETYTRDFKKGALKNLTLVAWQLPMLERQSAFVVDSSGRANVSESGRGGRDLALYGAQARTRFAINPKVALTLSAADLYFSGTQFITPAQFFGGQLQVPVTVTLPATA